MNETEKMSTAMADWTNKVLNNKNLEQSECQVDTLTDPVKRDLTVILYHNEKIIGKRRFKFKNFYN